jgi:hypothetical protein
MGRVTQGSSRPAGYATPRVTARCALPSRRSIYPAAANIIVRTCGSSTTTDLVSSVRRTLSRTKCGCARRQRTVRCRLRELCSTLWARGLGRGPCTRSRRLCVTRSVVAHCARAADPPPLAQIDSLVPAYACPAADAVRDAFQAVPAWTTHLSDNAPLKARLDAVFGTAGLDAWASWCSYPPPVSSPR